MLKLWGRPDSSATHKVLWTCIEAGIEYEFIMTGGKYGGLTDPEYLAMNPTLRIPTILDDGYVGWESNSCARYLAAKYASGTLWPEDLQIRAEADKWMDWQCTHWMDIVPAFAWLIRGTETFGAAEGVEPSRLKSLEAYQMLEDRLEDRDYVAGDSFTMGDIALCPRVHQFLNLDIDTPGMPNIKAWYARLKERPSFDQVFTLPLT
ncbi:MAG: glutathione S-transferase family protein [Proteobacteria bacterium]|nr:glutathione S-transferase family protein [Pseudomonadota bacterium]